MKHDPKPSDELGDTLRRGDPARYGTPPSDREIARMRQLIVVEADRRTLPIRLAAPVFATFAVALVTFFLGWNVVRLGGVADRLVPAIGGEADVRAGAHDAQSERSTPRVRQVQFLTPGGTRVVWLLNPDFDV